MLELIAQGPTIDHRWRRQIPTNLEIELGRATDSYRVPWDNQVSRRHVKIVAAEHHVLVTRLEAAANPVFFNGSEANEFRLNPGQHFVIGATTFLLAADQAFGSMSAPSPFSQKTFSSDFLQKVKYRDADRRIEVINRIPEVIANANDTNELLIGMINTLMAGIVTATTIGIVRHVVNEQVANSNETGSSLEIVHWDRRGFERGDFQPSAKLVAQAVESGEYVLNVWHPDHADAPEQYTFDYKNDWAFACPIESPATPNWSIYVAGQNSKATGDGSTASDGGSADELDLDGDIKFCELVGSTLKNLLQVQRLERQQASLRTFFSPVVVEAIRNRNAEEILAPKKCDVTVLFCDLRGFSKASEAMSDDLLGLLERVSESLGIMTSTILDCGGVVGDFHGDAVMGFWGWPLDVSDRRKNAANAVKAALAIQTRFYKSLSQQRDSKCKLDNFHVGLGLASGEAVAGKIGTRDQVKVTVFGPVVNLAARLEGMTRQLNSVVLADRETVNRLIEPTPGSLEHPMHRLLGTFQPFGLERNVDVFQLAVAGAMQPKDVEYYHVAIDQFTAGNWSAAQSTLQTISETDSARLFLESLMAGRDTAPSDFEGIIRMTNK